MKKIIRGILLFATVCIITGCGATKEIKLVDVENANTSKNLLETYDHFGVNTIYYLDGQEQESEYIYLEKNNGNYVYAHESSNKDVSVLKDKAVYSFFDSEKNFAKQVFIKDQYDSFVKDSLLSNLIDFDENEKILVNKVEDNVRVLETKYDVADDKTGYLSSIFGEEGGSLNYKYKLDKNTLALLEGEAYINDKLLMSLKINYDTKYEIPEFVNDLENPTETRKCTVLIDPKEPNEEKIDFLIPKNVYMQISPLDGYQLYADEEGKTLLETTLPDPSMDTIIYMKKI